MSVAMHDSEATLRGEFVREMRDLGNTLGVRLVPGTVRERTAIALHVVRALADFVGLSADVPRTRIDEVQTRLRLLADALESQ